MPTTRIQLAFATVVAATVLLAACAPLAPSGNAPPEAQQSEVPRVSLEEAKSALDADSAIFLDVRAPSSYAAQRIPGALNIPLADIEARLGELDKAAWIITYCT